MKQKKFEDDYDDWTLDAIQEEIFEMKQKLLEWALETAPRQFQDCVYYRQKLKILWRIEERGFQ